MPVGDEVPGLGAGRGGLAEHLDGTGSPSNLQREAGRAVIRWAGLRVRESSCRRPGLRGSTIRRPTSDGLGEIVAMFSQRESRDELGLGRIRDALSDTLFPGTSFLLTRARYLLFVPWLYREGARRGHGGPKLTQWVEWNERQLIGALHRGEDLEGLIGRFAGAAVRDLPSSLYWNTLRRFGILRHEGTEGQVASLRQISRPQDEATEFLEHSDAVWAPSTPPAPDGFFSYESCNFTLTHDEATWLAERIIDAVPDSLLRFLVMQGKRLPESTAYAWEDPEAVEAEGPVRDALDEARRFSVAMHGASLLYNLLLAERAEELGLAGHEGRRDRYTTRLDEWQKDFRRNQRRRPGN